MSLNKTRHHHQEMLRTDLTHILNQDFLQQIPLGCSDDKLEDYYIVEHIC